MFIKDIYLKYFHKKPMEEKKIIFTTRLCNVLFCSVAMAISFFKIDIVTMNTFAFAIRCAGPFAAYGLGLVVPRATVRSGILSIITGTIGVVYWQILSGGGFYMGVLPVVFGSAVGVATFFIVNLIEWKLGVRPAPSAYHGEDNNT